MVHNSKKVKSLWFMVYWDEKLCFTWYKFTIITWHLNKINWNNQNAKICMAYHFTTKALKDEIIMTKLKIVYTLLIHSYLMTQDRQDIIQTCEIIFLSNI